MYSVLTRVSHYTLTFYMDVRPDRIKFIVSHPHVCLVLSPLCPMFYWYNDPGLAKAIGLLSGKKGGGAKGTAKSLGNVTVI